MASDSNQGAGDDSSHHNSMVVSSTGIDDRNPAVAGVAGKLDPASKPLTLREADLSPEAVAPSRALQRYASSAARSEAWHPHRAARQHFTHLIAEVDTILSAIEGAQVAH
ncbi:hypothetical protein CLCR_02171 [Cladophialophora carrionii]|uniref:Uncharacterized protein n=1 Tax=Cladophialophora carrionii TaxID=86049 RepID=A0A1C1CDW7_9EURO|nr:hypothetical protein CLCR_02171 [Cladophialophora carrionii]